MRHPLTPSKQLWTRRRGLAGLSLAALLCTTGATLRRDFSISGRVIGASGKHPIYVALWSDDGFLVRPVQQVRLDPGTESHFQFTVPEGRWTISAFEDMNGNGVLDMGVFGPKEPNGFWRPFSGWRKPRFDDVDTLVDKDIPDANIALR